MKPRSFFCPKSCFSPPSVPDKRHSPQFEASLQILHHLDHSALIHVVSRKYMKAKRDAVFAHDHVMVI